MQPSLQRVERVKKAVGNAARDACGCQLSHEVARHPRKPDTAHASHTKHKRGTTAEQNKTLSEFEGLRIERVILGPYDSSPI